MPVRRSPLRSVALAADRTAWDGAGCSGYPNFAPPQLYLEAARARAVTHARGEDRGASTHRRRRAEAGGSGIPRACVPGTREPRAPQL